MSDNATHILLVRHGATTSTADDRFAGSSDVELSDAGLKQAQALGDRLRVAKIDAAYCSPMHRAIRTANAIVQSHGLMPTQLPALREIDHGHWEGVPHKQVEQQFAVEYAAWNADPLNTVIPGGESGRKVLDRAMPALKDIVARHPRQTVVVVSHKATNRLLIAALMGMDARRYRDRLGQDLACLNILDFADAENARLTLLNDTSHYQASS